MSSEKIPIWLDCDPGHDDAFAIIMATQSPQIDLLGISIVHGNDTVDHCAKNALRILWSCGVKGVGVWKGVERPLVRKPKFCPEIHGVPGEDGVAGMCGWHFPDTKIFDVEGEYKVREWHGVIAMAETIKNHDNKVTVVLTGAQTNLAMCLRMFPEVGENIEKVVFMGGAIGLGNTGVAAEFNIQIDPEAASVVLHSGIPLVMVPLEVTHKVLVTPNVLEKLAAIDKLDLYVSNSEVTMGTDHLPHRHVEYKEVHEMIERNRFLNAADVAIGAPHVAEFTSPFAECCFRLLTFFQGSYLKEFGFKSPPLHDPCTIFYVTNPDCFRTISCYVDVEMESEKCSGRTLCDVNNLWKKDKNVTICTDIDTERFWERMLLCVKEASGKSPLNK